jgi:hypothetical protein
MEDGYIEWACPSCGDNGVISHWQGSPYDLSEVRDLPNQPGFEIMLTEEEYDELRKCLVMSPEGDKLIYGATYTEEGIVLRTTRKDLEDFAGYLEFNINHEEDRKRQQILHQVLDRVEAVLGTWRWSLS